METFKLIVYKEDLTEGLRKVIRFRLSEDSRGICLFTVDENGRRVQCGNILRITPEGYLSRSCGVNPDLGLPLDKEGQIKFLPEEG